MGRSNARVVTIRGQLPLSTAPTLVMSKGLSSAYRPPDRGSRGRVGFGGRGVRLASSAFGRGRIHRSGDRTSWPFLASPPGVTPMSDSVFAEFTADDDQLAVALLAAPTYRGAAAPLRARARS